MTDYIKPYKGTIYKLSHFRKTDNPFLKIRWRIEPTINYLSFIIHFITTSKNIEKIKTHMKIHHLTGYIQSVYLIEYPQGLLLLDGCCRADVAMLTAFIKQDLQRPLTDLKTLIVTHMHPDHAGAAHKLRQLTGCVIVSANKPTQWYRGLNGLLMHWIDMTLTLYVAKRLKKPWKNVLYNRKLIPDVKAKAGDPVPHFPDWSLLETPGHTDRDLSVLHTEKNWVYVADLIIKLRSRFIAPFPVFHPNQYRQSLGQIKALSPAKIMLAHGGMLQMQDADFDQMIEQSPKIPRTPLRASLLKFKRMTGRINKNMKPKE